MSQLSWRIQTFGRLSVRQGATVAKFRTQKTEQLIALLTTISPDGVPRDTIANRLWPEANSPRQSLRMALTDIRSVLSEDVLVVDRDTIQLEPDKITSDYGDFYDCIKESEYRKALEQIKGPFLDGSIGEWISTEWNRIQDDIAESCVKLLASSEDDSDVKLVKGVLGHLDVREDVHIAIIRWYVRKNLSSLAIAQFEILEKQLDDAWGEPPSQMAWEVIQSSPRLESPKISSIRNADSDRLVGRKDDLDTLASLIQNAAKEHFITLFGPGGVGKTTLALELHNNNSESSLYVDLRSCNDQETFLRAIQTELHIPHGEAGDALSSIIHRLKAMSGVVWLDNFEQIVNVAQDSLAKMVRQCPNLRFLLTSRKRLDATNEILFNVSPLGLPSSENKLEEVRNTPSVRLFERRSQQVQPHFRVDANNARSVVNLCNRLDGIPMAIELAATRILVRTPAEIVSDLENLPNLSGTQSLRVGLAGMLDRSIQLLSQVERDIFFSATLFHKDFTKEEVNRVSGIDTSDLVLESLVSISLVKSDCTGKQARYWVLESIRTAFLAVNRFSENAEVIQIRFASHLLDVAQQTNEVAAEEDGRQYAEHLNRIDDYISGLEFCLTKPELYQIGADLAITLRRAITLYNLGNRFRQIFQQYLDLPSGSIDQLSRGWLMLMFHALLSNLKSIDDRFEPIEKAIEEYRDNWDLKCTLQIQLAILHKSKGTYDIGLRIMEEVFEHIDQVSMSEQAKAYYTAAQLYCCIDDRVSSVEYVLKALKASRRSDDLGLNVRILFDAGAELAHAKDFTLSLELFEEAIQKSQALGSPKLEGLTKWQLGDAFVSMSRYVDALKSLLESADLLVGCDFAESRNWLFLKTGQALANISESELAILFLAKGRFERIKTSRPLAVYEQVDFDQAMSMATSKLSSVKVDRFVSDGEKANWDILYERLRTLVTVL